MVGHVSDGADGAHMVGHVPDVVGDVAQRVHADHAVVVVDAARGVVAVVLRLGVVVLAVVKVVAAAVVAVVAVDVGPAGVVGK